MTDREVMKQALLALEGWDNYGKWAWPDTALEQSKRNTTESLASLRAALEQPEQEPLTGEQIEFAWMKAMQNTPGTTLPIHEFARAIEAAHGIGEKP